MKPKQITTFFKKHQLTFHFGTNLSGMLNDKGKGVLKTAEKIGEVKIVDEDLESNRYWYTILEFVDHGFYMKEAFQFDLSGQEILRVEYSVVEKVGEKIVPLFKQVGDIVDKKE